MISKVLQQQQQQQRIDNYFDHIIKRTKTGSSDSGRRTVEMHVFLSRMIVVREKPSLRLPKLSKF